MDPFYESMKDAEELREVMDKVKALLMTTPDLIIFKDGADRWLYANQYAQSFYGLDESVYQGKTSAELAYIKPDYKHVFLARYEEDQRVWGKKSISRKEITFQNLEGNSVTLEVVANPFFHQDGRRKGLVVFGRDITKLKVAEENKAQLSYYNPVTKLPNRLLLEKKLEYDIIAANVLQKKFAVFILGVDRFSRINDTLGSAIGDQLLNQVAQRLKNLVHDYGNFLSHVGGDEFVIIYPIRKDASVGSMAESILRQSDDPFVVGDEEIFVTISIGICNYPGDGEDVHTLMKHANIALHHAKRKGKNGYQIYTEMLDAAASKSFSLENSLHKALKLNQLELYYQPKVDIHTEKIIGVEALIRWNHPTWGLVSPNEFIPIAEETGLMIPIGKWVKETAVKQNKEWQQSGLDIVPIAVNISAKRFMQKEFVNNLSKVLQEVGLAPEYLEIEITETSLMEFEELATETIEQLHELGIKIAIDDFGTGYSTFSYLKQFKVDSVKMDRTFIKEIGKTQQDDLIVKGMINLLKTLKLNVIGEGVETEEQLRFLRACMCDQAQGYLYSKPVKAEEFKALLVSSRNGTRR